MGRRPAALAFAAALAVALGPLAAAGQGGRIVVAPLDDLVLPLLPPSEAIAPAEPLPGEEAPAIAPLDESATLDESPALDKSKGLAPAPGESARSIATPGSEGPGSEGPAYEGPRSEGEDGEAPPVERVIAVLQGLYKITARIATFEAPVDEPVRFGRLDILVRACHKRPPEEPPESAAFLEIGEETRDGGRARHFSGWMFASSPALSAMDHPVYDVWVIDCKKSSKVAGASSD